MTNEIEKEKILWLSEHIWYKWTPQISSLPSTQFGANYEIHVSGLKIPQIIKSKYFTGNTMNELLIQAKYLGRTLKGPTWGRHLGEISRGQKLQQAILQWPRHKYLSMDIYDLYALSLVNIDAYHDESKVELVIRINYAIYTGHGEKKLALETARQKEIYYIQQMTNDWEIGKFFLLQ
eukprot:503529_1